MLLHSDFQNGSPPLSLFHRTFQIAAGVGAAKTWKDPDFGTRSYSTRIQGSTPKDKNYWRYLLKQGLVPLFLSAEKSHRLFPTLFSGPPQRFASFELRAADWHRRVAGD